MAARDNGELLGIAAVLVGDLWDVVGRDELLGRIGLSPTAVAAATAEEVLLPGRRVAASSPLLYRWVCGAWAADDSG
jgi:hypothetical protein